PALIVAGPRPGMSAASSVLWVIVSVIGGSSRRWWLPSSGRGNRPATTARSRFRLSHLVEPVAQRLGIAPPVVLAGGPQLPAVLAERLAVGAADRVGRVDQERVQVGRAPEPFGEAVHLPRDHPQPF